MKNLFLLIFTLFTGLLFSQKTTVRGIVADAKGGNLPGATLILLEKKDSVMAAFSMTDAAGKFELNEVPKGQFLLQISYLGFEPNWQSVEILGEKPGLDLGKIALSASAATLQSVEILGERDPMHMSNDTVEYNAAAFKVRPGDPAEALLRKMPGIEVERDGTVKAHGEKVQNVLVDGKEFFGKDTRIATKNLPADAIDKVQVFDKKSDMAEFTGIEDGQDERTINLKLKPGKKAGYFGKADGGGGVDEAGDGRFSGRFNVNRFSPKTRLSAIGMANNVNEQGFSFDEYLEFMGGIGAFMSGSGRVEIGGDEAAGLPIGDGSAVAGIQNSVAGGLNLSHDFSKKADLTGSYFINRLENELETEARQDNFLADGIFKNTENGQRNSRNLAHRFNLVFKNKIDSFQRLTVRADAGLSDAFLRSKSATATFGTDGFLENGSDRSFSADGKNLNFRSSMVYKKRFRRPGRAFISSVSGRISDRDSDGNLFSENHFFGNPASVDTIFQRQKTGDFGLQYGLNMAWTEPLGRRQYLKFDAARDNFSNENGKNFYDITPLGEMRNSLISNEFRRDFTADRVGGSYLLNRKKYNLTAGLAFQNSRLNGKIADAPDDFSVKFSRLLPSLFFEKEFKTSNRLNLDYVTDLREPSLEQLQPVSDNSDPLNQFLGNPNLRPEFVHDLRLGYFLYDAFSFTTFFASLNGSFVQDKITNSSSVDDLFRRTITPVNTSHELRFRGNLQFSTPIRPLKISTKIKLNSTFSQGFVFVNSIKNEVGRRRDAVDFSVENRKKQKIDALFGFRLAHNTTNWSANGELNRDFTDTQFYSEIALSPNDNWLLETKFEGTVYSAETFGERQFIPMWQAGLTRYFLKSKKGRLRISAVNLLNQNLGIRRSSDLNFVRQENVNALGRYFLLSFGYSISGFQKDTGALEIKVGD